MSSLLRMLENNPVLGSADLLFGLSLRLEDYYDLRYLRVLPQYGGEQLLVTSLHPLYSGLVAIQDMVITNDSFIIP